MSGGAGCIVSLLIGKSNRLLIRDRRIPTPLILEILTQEAGSPGANAIGGL